MVTTRAEWSMPAAEAPTVEVLGTAQDAGVPHVGCRCDRCEAARESPEARRTASALMLETDGSRYLFDATPDLPTQIADVPDGVFLTHAHLGHLPGLLYFGREAADATDLPVYCTGGLADLIHENAPFSALVDDDCIDLRAVGDETTVSAGDVDVTPTAVTHRETFPTGTLSYRIEGPHRSLYYVSDVDEWTDDVLDEIARADVALVDGTFWSPDELDRVAEVPHPPIRESMDAFADLDTAIRFTHLNHTNPVLDPDSPERGRLEERGYGVVEAGQRFDL
jgi:pyrroloquinoline quinone biosynthesis protein B